MKTFSERDPAGTRTGEAARWLALILGFMLILTLPGCSSDEPAPTTEAPPQVDAPPSPIAPSSTGPPIAPPPSIADLEWESMGGPPGAGRVTDLVQTYGATHTLYALNAHGVYTSEDQGNHWDPVPAPGVDWLSTIAVHEDDLILCGHGVHVVSGSSIDSIHPEPCDAIGAMDDTIAIGTSSQTLDGIRIEIRRGDDGEWADHSPTAADLDDLTLPPVGPNFGVLVGALVPTEDGALAAITVWVEGSGEHTNGGLYRLDDEGWKRVRLDTPSTAVVDRLVVDPQESGRIVALLRHALLHEQRSSVSGLAWESTDDGVTWAPLTDAVHESNGVTHVVTHGATEYLLSPGDGYILGIENGSWETLAMPVVADFPDFAFPLERLLFDPNDPDVAYGMPGKAWELGLLRSTDGMQTWHKMDARIVASSPTVVVSHPHDPSVLLTSGNVIQESYATFDAGTTWQPFSPVTAGDELRVDPHDPRHLLLVDESTGLFESHDRGASFERIGDDFTTAKVLDVEIAPSGEAVYVSNLGVGITRLGQDEPFHMSNSPDYAYDIEIDPDDSRILYAANSPKKFERHASIWRYDPDQAAGFGWSEIRRVDNSAGITSLAFDPSDSDTIYAGVTGPEGTVWVSRDKGETWSPLNPDLTFTTVQGQSQLLVSRTNDDVAIVGTWGGGSFATSNGGTTWSMLDEHHTFSPTCLVPAPSDPNIIYACDRTAPKIHRSIDGGASWSEYFDFGAGHLTTTTIAVDPGEPDLIYAAAFRPPAAMLGSFFKIRAGEVIADAGGTLPRAVIEVALDEENPATLYVSTHLHGVYRSDDAGATWQRLDDRGTGLPRTGYLDIDVDPTDSRIVYATSLCGELPSYVTDPIRDVLATTEAFRNLDPNAACGLYRSTNRGNTWQLLLETAGEAKAIDVSRSDSDHLVVADSGAGIWVSRDGGANWRQENGGLPTTSLTAVAIGTDRIYAATQGSGVFTSTFDASGRLSWDGATSPRAYVYRLQVEVDPGNSQRIYAAAYPGGVMRSDDGGRTWAAKNFLTPSIRVADPVLQGYYALEIDPTDPETVWLGVYGKGLIVSRDGRDFGIAANGPDQLLRGKHITSVAVDPQDASRILVGSEEGLFITTDSGRTWAAHNAGMSTADVRTLEFGTATFVPYFADFDEDDGGFALDPGWSLTDGALVGEGHTWANGGSRFWGDYVFQSDVVLDRGGVHINARVSSEGRYAIALGDGTLHLFKQFNEWQDFADLVTKPARIVPGRSHRLQIELEGARIRVLLDGALQIEYTDPEPILSGAIAFETLEDSRASVDNVRVDPTPGPSEAYVGTGGYGVYRFDRTTESWVSSGRTFGFGWWAPWERRMYQFSSIVFDPEVEDRVYFGHFPSGFFISDDGGNTWRDSSVGLGNDGMFSVTQHPSDPDVLFAGTYNGIVRSDDAGATWTDSSSGMPPEQWPYTVAIDGDDPDVMYTSTKNGKNMGFCHRNDFCGVVMKSTDGGTTWQRIMNGLEDRNEYYTLLIYPPDHDTLFLSSSNGVFVSVDAGATWWPMNEGLPSTHNQVRDNVADNLTLSADHRWLFLGLVAHGVWRADVTEFAPE